MAVLQLDMIGYEDFFVGPGPGAPTPDPNPNYHSGAVTTAAWLSATR